MATDYIWINLRNDASSDNATETNVNNITQTGGASASNLILKSDGTNSGLTFQRTAGTVSGSVSHVISPTPAYPDNGLSAEIKKSNWYTASSFTITIDGTMPSGKKVTAIDWWGCASQNDASRQSRLTQGAVSDVHDGRNYGNTEPAPESITVDISSAPFDITCAREGGAGFGYFGYIRLTLEDFASAPVITDVDTDNDVYPGQDAVITGTGFGAVEGTVSITSPSGLTTISQPVTGYGDTSATITVVNISGSNALPFKTGQTLTLTDDNAASDTHTITLSPPAGTTVVDVVDPLSNSSSLFQDASPAVAAPDQVWWELVSGTNVVVNANGTMTSDSATAVITFRIWDATDETISAEYTATLQDGVVSVGGGRKQFRISFGMGF